MEASSASAPGARRRLRGPRTRDTRSSYTANTDPCRPANFRPRPALTARGESLASHRDERGAPPARRDDREYREYLKEEQRRRRGCIARRMQPDFHYGLLSPAEGPPYPLKATPSSAHPRY